MLVQMADVELQRSIAARDKQVTGLLSNPSGALKAALADPPYAATENETRVRPLFSRNVCVAREHAAAWSRASWFVCTHIQHAFVLMMYVFA